MKRRLSLLMALVFWFSCVGRVHAQDLSGISIGVLGPVDAILTDEHGQRTTLLQDGSSSAEIPDSYAEITQVPLYYEPTQSPPALSRQRVIEVNQLQSSQYTLSLTGEAGSDYDLDIYLQNQSAESIASERFGLTLDGTDPHDYTLTIREDTVRIEPALPTASAPTPTPTPPEPPRGWLTALLRWLAQWW